MWRQQFNQRLESWVELRNQAKFLPLEESLFLINAWWFNTPWQAYYLHWDDQKDWPDPWQLLSDNVYCSLARGLGIMYTIAIIDRKDMKDARLVQTTDDNLVLVDTEKYILTYDASELLNNRYTLDITKQLTLSQLQQKIN